MTVSRTLLCLGAFTVGQPPPPARAAAAPEAGAPLSAPSRSARLRPSPPPAGRGGDDEGGGGTCAAGAGCGGGGAESGARPKRRSFAPAGTGNADCAELRRKAVEAARLRLAEMDGMASSTRAYWRTKAARCPELLADLPSDEAEREYHDLDSTRYYLKSVARWLLTAIAAGLVLGPGPLPGSLCDSTWPLNMFPADDGVREWAEVALRDGYVDWGRGAAELRRANVALFLSRASGRGEDWELFGAAHPQHPGWRRSALLSAARGGDAELLLFLLARGVAADTVDVWGRGVLHYLALRGAAPPQELQRLSPRRCATLHRVCLAPCPTLPPTTAGGPPGGPRGRTRPGGCGRGCARGATSPRCTGRSWMGAVQRG
eukprot:TRINITY_DN39771_c0_g1_i1.p1 TRINITY_DN39771_c0_g1~~TRINITY_DN39771_c0_g1_i1.p1  ORF type:complete len:374 (+),score=40.43 TRINITY_DN39771_c0_g1_i1:98-1219(+)